MVVHYWGDTIFDFLYNSDFVKKIHFSTRQKITRQYSKLYYCCCLGTEIISMQWNQQSGFHHFYIIHEKVNTAASKMIWFYPRWHNGYIVYVKSKKIKLFWECSISTGCVCYFCMWTVLWVTVKADTVILCLAVEFSNMQWYCMLVKRIFKMYVNIFKPMMEISHFIFLTHLSKTKCPFVGVFAKKLQTVVTSFIKSVHHLTWNSVTSTREIFLTFHIWDFY